MLCGSFVKFISTGKSSGQRRLNVSVSWEFLGVFKFVFFREVGKREKVENGDC